MIKHHPSSELLQRYAAGELPAALAIAVSAHCELCPHCAQKTAAAETQLAMQLFESEQVDVDEHQRPAAIASATTDSDAALALMLDTITDQAPQTTVTAPPAHFVCIDNQHYRLPNALSHVSHQQWRNLGAISRMRYNIDEQEGGRLSLLHISSEGKVPSHTHKGQEITLVLDGAFTDVDGRYQQGDFLLRNNQHQHAPQSEHGCLCLTVVDAPLHFTDGFSKLLNPFGNMLY